MQDETAFLAAIDADPDDRTARLAFADWLDEHGDADRAEFVRVRAELDATGLPPHDDCAPTGGTRHWSACARCRRAAELGLSPVLHRERDLIAANPGWATCRCPRRNDNP